MKLPTFARSPDDERGLLSRLVSTLAALPGRLSGRRKERSSQTDDPNQDWFAARQGASRRPDEMVVTLLSGETQSPCLPASQDLDLRLAAGVQPYSRARDYRIHVPDGIVPGQPVPLVVALHGCLQSHLDMQKVCGLDRIADRERFIVAYPSVTGLPGLRNLNCWGWWSRKHRQRGHGEVEDIWRIIETIARDQPVDLSRVHVCGLSAGAGMTVAALVAYSDRIASGASVAGLAYGENTRAVQISRHLTPRYASLSSLLSNMRLHLATRSPPPLLIIQSSDDSTVAPICAQHLRQCWEQTTQSVRDTDRATQGSTHGVPWQLDSYFNSDERLAIMQLTVEGVGHGWLGGAPGRFSTPHAPDIAELIWWFFVRSTRSATITARRSHERLEPSIVPLVRAS